MLFRGFKRLKLITKELRTIPINPPYICISTLIAIILPNGEVVIVDVSVVVCVGVVGCGVGVVAVAVVSGMVEVAVVKVVIVGKIKKNYSVFLD